MSDLEGSAAPVPPPPPPPPPPAFSAPAYGAPGAAPGGYPPAPGTAPAPGKPPRPPVVVASVLLLLGAVAMGLGAFLTWYEIGGVALDGLDIDDFNSLSEDDDLVGGGVLIFFAVVAAAFAITGLFARRVLAVAIIAVVFASLGVLVTIAALSQGADQKDFAEAFRIDFEWGPGLAVAMIGSLVALAGSIATLSKRRRWR